MKETKEYDKAYLPPETIKIDYCAAVLAVILKYHPQAKDLFENVKDCTLLLGVQETFSTIENKIPEGKKLIKWIVTKAGYDKKSKPDANPVKSARRLLGGTFFAQMITGSPLRPLLIAAQIPAAPPPITVVMLFSMILATQCQFYHLTLLQGSRGSQNLLSKSYVLYPADSTLFTSKHNDCL